LSLSYFFPGKAVKSVTHIQGRILAQQIDLRRFLSFCVFVLLLFRIRAFRLVFFSADIYTFSAKRSIFIFIIESFTAL